MFREFQKEEEQANEEREFEDLLVIIFIHFVYLKVQYFVIKNEKFYELNTDNALQQQVRLKISHVYGYLTKNRLSR